MSEREPAEGENVVVQTKDPGPLFFGYVRGRRVHGSLECSPGPIAFPRVHRWLPVPAPPDLPRSSYDDDIPF